jgi:hypothetical protein
MNGMIKARLLLLLLVTLTVPVTAALAQDVTFTKDVAPILQRSCQNCHRPDSIAPMSLLTYEQVRPWARAICPLALAALEFLCSRRLVDITPTV